MFFKNTINSIKYPLSFLLASNVLAFFALTKLCPPQNNDDREKFRPVLRK